MADDPPRLQLLRTLAPYFANAGLALVALLALPRLADLLAEDFAAPPAAATLTARCGPPCTLETVLHIAYTNASPHAFRYLVVFGIDTQGAVHGYYPQTAEQTSVSIADGQPLPGGVLLGLGHLPGRMQVYGVFSDEPLTLGEASGKLLRGEPPHGQQARAFFEIATP